MMLPAPITSRTNAKVKALRAAFEGRASRPGEMVAIEGATLIGEAVRSGVRLETVFVRQGSEAVLESLRVSGVPVVVLTREVFASAVDTSSPQGVAAMIAIPRIEKRPDGHGRGALLSGVGLVLEAIQDPGNVGTMLRAAEAFGVSQVMVTGETANAWSPKAVRASAGSVFRVPVLRMSLEEIADWAAKQGVHVYAAVAQAKGAVACVDVDLARECAVMIGNEGAGLSQAALEMADVRVHIPCITESLNAAAAAATLLYEAMRQRIAQTVPAVGVAR
ncbi:MAG TPA: RNA methyltransferase [Steroidobacteraceae bacterium]|nr:RNA methyltransferase [Steroidobacteraceae bacterium]